MRRLGKILFGVLTAAAIGGTGLSTSSICRAARENLTVGEVYDTALEAAYGATFRSAYENRLFGSPPGGRHNTDTNTNIKTTTTRTSANHRSE